MKKKLIAAVVSVAMVATMVPSMAFATSTAVPVSEGTVRAESNVATYDDVKAELAKHTTDQSETVTYADKAAYDALAAQIGALSPSEQAKLKTETETGYNNFMSEKATIDEIANKIEVAKDAISKIATSIGPNDTTVTAARTAYDAVPADKLGTDALGKAYTVEKIVGSANLEALKTAEKILAVAKKIDKMPAVTSSNYTNYANQALSAPETGTVTTLTTAYNDLGTVNQNRVANKAAYNEKLQDVENVKTAKAAMDKITTDITNVVAPFTQAKLDAAQKALDDAINAVKVLPSSVNTNANPFAWDAIIGNSDNSYKSGSAHTKIATMKSYLENDAVVKPVADGIKALPEVKDLTWSDAAKDQVFAVTYAYSQLTSDQKTFLRTYYASENTKYTALTQQATGWYKQESDNKASAKAWLTAKINNIPATVTLADAALVKEAKAAYDEYATGYLKNLLIALDDSASDKLAAAVKDLNTLEADKLAADKAAAKKFVELANNLPSTIGLSDKALVQEARAAYDKLTDDQKALEETDCNVVNAYETLKAAEKTIAGLENAGDTEAIANELIVAIRALPAKDKLTLAADKDTVYALNDKYLAAIEKNSAVKNEVNNATTLFTAVGTIMDLEIADLPILKADGTETKADIDAAAAKIAPIKAQYDKIGKEQQSYVAKTSMLDNAVAQLSKAQVKYADTILAEAAKIDTTKDLTKEDAAAIEVAQKAVAELTETQTAALNQTNLKALKETLIPALEAYQKSLKALEKATVKVADATYTGSAVEPAVEVTAADGTVIDKDAYKVSYENNVNAGTATVVVSSITDKGYTGHKTQTFEIKAASLEKATVTAGTKTYNGKAQKPAVKVVLNGKTLTSADYNVAYANNVKVGKATVTITGTGNYTGTAAGSFAVKPGKASITSVKAGTKKLTVKVKAIPGDTQYKIAYKQKGSNYKYQTTKTSSTTKTITGLKSGKTYKVKVLAFTKVNGKSYYTGYSTIKTIKVK